MKKLLAALLLSIAFSANAASVWTHEDRNNQLAVVGTDEACQLMNDARLKRADVVYQGTHLKACWTQLDNEHVFIVDETGDAGSLRIGTGI